MSIEQVAREAPGPAPAALRESLARLDEEDLIVLEDGVVRLAYPFSGDPTVFTVVLPDGRARFVCCAAQSGLRPTANGAREPLPPRPRPPLKTPVRSEPSASAPYWVEAIDGHARFRAKIAGLHCSLCTGTISFLGWTVGLWCVTGQADLPRAVFAGLSVLVIGYPCAVGIAAPLSIVRGAGAAADRGILMRTGKAFQPFRTVTRVVFDKTGTLTMGRPTVSTIHALGREDEVLALAAAAEASSEHPLGHAILTAALDRGLRVPAVQDFEAVAGLGVSAVVDGERVRVGRPAYLGAQGVALAPLQAWLAEREREGHTVVAVSRDHVLVSALALGDTLRPGAAEALAGLKQAGVIPVLVTGDNRGTAERVARAVAIEEVHAEVLPGEKATIIRRLRERGRSPWWATASTTPPALMQADVGVAMGAGTDVALESTDIIIVSNRLGAVLTVREISRRSFGKTKQDVVLAFLFNGIGIPVATTGLVYAVWAMVATAVSVTSIFVNSLWGRPALFFDAVLSVGRPSRRELAPWRDGRRDPIWARSEAEASQAASWPSYRPAHTGS